MSKCGTVRSRKATGGCGKNIKLAGDDPSVGVYFFPKSDPSTRLKLTRICLNESGRIIGVAPNTNAMTNKLEIITQYSKSGSVKPDLRVITGRFELTAM